MEIASIRGRDVALLYHPAETTAEVGTLFSLTEPEGGRGLVVQLLENESLSLDGMLLGQVQRLLEDQVFDTQTLLDRESGLEAVGQLKVGRCKVRAKIAEGRWQAPDGWIPARNVDIRPVAAEAVLKHLFPQPTVPLRPFASYHDRPLVMDATKLGLVNLIVGNRGGGKSHITKHLLLGMAERKVPVIALDVNNEYDLGFCQVLTLGKNFHLSLSEQGPRILLSLVQSLAPLQPASNSEVTFETLLPKIMREREQKCRDRGVPYTVDLAYLRQVQWDSNHYVQDAIISRLDRLEDMGVFGNETERGRVPLRALASAYEEACGGQPIVFDLAGMGQGLQSAFVKALVKSLTHVCQIEHTGGTSRYPYILADESHTYMTEGALTDLVTRSRHIGAGLVLATNSPDKIPDVVARLADNIICGPISHRDDLRAVAKATAAFCDEESLQALATSLPPRHALILGEISGRWPLVVAVEKLPDELPATGVTRSAWARFAP